ncbi:hypothetical protein REPUB_Repub15cG0098000 [Reevesia pubescens]
MGCMATVAHLGGSQVLDIIPRVLTTRNITEKIVGEEIIVSCMHERMKTMIDNVNAFIALPNGFGNLEEIFQIASSVQLNIHRKPIGVLNVNGFYNSLFSFLDHGMEHKFISQVTCQILITTTTPDQLINQLQAFIPKLDLALALLDCSKEINSRKQRLHMNISL